ncbi:hypothetical protein [Fibrella arboris]|uniref:hypothetical protein n=1 Tax=Fibrella arboris TaxID=3242486 RepID=UPI0035208DCF
MPLTNQQLADLRHDLTSLADIRYDHLADELLDHYATLTEEKMATGLSFYEASTDAFLAMGNGEGIRRIQVKYEIETKKQIKARYWRIVKSYCRWPTVVTTLLVGTLLVNLYLTLPANYLKTMTIALCLSPVFVVLSAWIPYYWQNDTRKKLVWKYISDNGAWPINTVNILINLYDFPTYTAPITCRMALILLLAIGCLRQSISLAQLTRETFYYKPIFQR